jgi:hypothetical protein
MTGIQIGGTVPYIQTRLTTRDLWAGSLYFLYMILGLICSTLASFQHILYPSLYTCWANFDFSNRLCTEYVGMKPGPYKLNLTSYRPTGNKESAHMSLLVNLVWIYLLSGSLSSVRRLESNNTTELSVI